MYNCVCLTESANRFLIYIFTYRVTLVLFQAAARKSDTLTLGRYATVLFIKMNM